MGWREAYFMQVPESTRYAFDANPVKVAHQPESIVGLAVSD